MYEVIVYIEQPGMIVMCTSIKVCVHNGGSFSPNIQYVLVYTAGRYSSYRGHGVRLVTTCSKYKVILYTGGPCSRILCTLRSL